MIHALGAAHFPRWPYIWLSAEACSYRIRPWWRCAQVLSGPGAGVMLGLWSLLPQFTYTKM